MIIYRKYLIDKTKKYIRLQIVYAFRQKYDADNDISIQQE